MTSVVDGARTRPVHLAEIGPPMTDGGADELGPLLRGEGTALVVREAFDQQTVGRLVQRLGAASGDPAWGNPNQAMPGGDVRVLGEAATPTFRTPRGPSLPVYLARAGEHDRLVRRVFGRSNDPWPPLARIMSWMAGHRAARRPMGPSRVEWPPYTVRQLGMDQQIYAHHDDHYGLAVFSDLEASVDRGALLSWFVTLAAPDSGGALVVYGLRSSDPDPPMLPTRFLDGQALDADYVRQEIPLAAGDLVVFDSGRHVHRITPVVGPRPRLTLGGFMGQYADGSAMACWS